MKVNKKSVTVKSFTKKHVFTIEETSMAGHHLVTLYKNNSPILKCTPREFVKLQRFFTIN
jgi:hypothetical protein